MEGLEFYEDKPVEVTELLISGRERSNSVTMDIQATSRDCLGGDYPTITYQRQYRRYKITWDREVDVTSSSFANFRNIVNKILNSVER